MYKKSEALSELRSDARRLGMTFKVKQGVTLNSGSLYQLISRKTKKVIVDNYQFWTAYEDSMSGYWHELNERWIINE